MLICDFLLATDSPLDSLRIVYLSFQFQVLSFFTYFLLVEFSGLGTYSILGNLYVRVCDIFHHTLRSDQSPQFCFSITSNIWFPCNFKIFVRYSSSSVNGHTREVTLILIRLLQPHYFFSS